MRDELKRCDVLRPVTHASGRVERKISRMHAHVISQTCGVNRCPQEMTKFSRQFVPDLARMSLSKRQRVKGIELLLSLTLIDTPLQLRVEIIHQWLGDIVIELGKNVDNRVESMIARGGHPFDFLQSDRAVIRRRKEREVRHTSIWVSGSFILSKILNTTLNSSIHQFWLNVSP